MQFTKGKIEYTIEERASFWVISYASGKIVADYRLPKSDFSTIDEVTEYIRTSDNFGG